MMARPRLTRDLIWGSRGPRQGGALLQSLCPMAPTSIAHSSHSFLRVGPHQPPQKRDREAGWPCQKGIEGKGQALASSPPWQQTLLMEDEKGPQTLGVGESLEMPPFRAVASTTVAALLAHGWATPKSGSWGSSCPTRNGK